MDYQFGMSKKCKPIARFILGGEKNAFLAGTCKLWCGYFAERMHPNEKDPRYNGKNLHIKF